MSRLPPLARESLGADQKKVWDALVAGPRGRVSPPFMVLLRTPEIADIVQQLGAKLRYGGALPDAVRELAVLTTSRLYGCAYEWQAHAPIAVKAGVPEAAVQAIAERREPTLADSDQILVYGAVRELHDTRRLSERTWGALNARFGEAGTVELVVLAGYYGLLALVLNGFGVGIPEGVKQPFPDLD